MGELSELIKGKRYRRRRSKNQCDSSSSSSSSRSQSSCSHSTSSESWKDKKWSRWAGDWKEGCDLECESKKGKCDPCDNLWLNPKNKWCPPKCQPLCPAPCPDPWQNQFCSPDPWKNQLCDPCDPWKKDDPWRKKKSRKSRKHKGPECEPEVKDFLLVKWLSAHKSRVKWLCAKKIIVKDLKACLIKTSALCVAGIPINPTFVGTFDVQVAANALTFMTDPSPPPPPAVTLPLAAGTHFVVQGTIVRAGTLPGGVDPVNFAGLGVGIGTWTAWGWFIGTAPPAPAFADAPVIIDKQWFDINDPQCCRVGRISTTGYQIIPSLQNDARSVDGGTGTFAGVKGVSLQSNIPFGGYVSTNDSGALGTYNFNFNFRFCLI